MGGFHSRRPGLGRKNCEKWYVDWSIEAELDDVVVDNEHERLDLRYRVYHRNKL